MAESIVQVTEGSGKKLHTYSYTVGANTVEDEVVVPGPFPNATYSVYSGNVSSATAASHVMQLMAGASLKVRVTRITIQAVGAATGVVRFEIVRVSTAGTGGTAIAARPYDSADAAAGAAGMTLPTVKGTETIVLGSLTGGFLGATQVYIARNDWTARAYGKAIVIPAGTTNGIVLKTSGLAASTYDVEFEFVETAF